MRYHEDEILEMSSPPHEVGEEDPTSTYDPHMSILHDLVMIPHSQVTGIGFRATRLTMNPQSLVMLDMAYLIFLSSIRHIMSSQNFTLALCLGALPLFSMRRGLGALVTLHPPSLWWRHLHMILLSLVLVILFRYQDRDDLTLGTPLTFIHMSLHLRTLFL